MAYPLLELALENKSHKERHILHPSQELYILILSLHSPWKKKISFIDIAGVVDAFPE